MNRIQKLDETLIAQIAAGEVIESPAAIVKELVENSLDAGATEIEIQIEGDGFTEIQVRDNGHGIHSADLPLAVESFATSKITSFDDLIAARTMGFRGEALGSIAAVSRLRVESRYRGSDVGSAVTADEHGKKTEISPIAAGSRVIVRDLFYNVPVRREFFSQTPKIHRQIADTITNITAANFQIMFRYRLGEEDPVVLPPRQNLIERIQDIWGDKIGGDIMPIYYEKDNLALEGYISKFYFYRNQGSDTRLWVNGRPVSYRPLTMLARTAYGELMPKGRFPFAVLFLTMDVKDVDVNVHPQKREIRFKHEVKVQNFLREPFTRTIADQGGISAANMVRMPHTQAQRNPEPKQSDYPLSTAAEPAQFLFSTQAALSPAADALPGLPENLVLHSRLFNTFIVATSAEGLFLIDQHTAHERINYERFLGLLAQKQDIAQTLVHPLHVEPAVFSRNQMRDAAPRLAALGFELEDLGPAGLVLKTAPGYVVSGEEEHALAGALKIIERGGTDDATDLFDQLAKDLSCRHAIRKGETASLTDFRELLEQLRRCKNPMRCPHGRPTIVKIDEREVFAYFKRT